MNPQLNELVDYIKKAQSAGQQDGQTRQILQKNGWSPAEINEAFSAILPTVSQQAQPNPNPKPASMPASQALGGQPQQESKPQQKPEPQIAVQQIRQQPQQQYQPAQARPSRRGSGLKFVLGLLIAIIVIAIAAAAGYFIFLNFSQPKPEAPIVENEPINEEPPPAQQTPPETLPEIPSRNISQYTPEELRTAADLMQIGSIAKSHFDSSGSLIDFCKGKGVLNSKLPVYGNQLVDLVKDIVKQGAQKSICFSSEQNFCFSTQLANGNWHCISSSGAVGLVECATAGTACQ